MSAPVSYDILQPDFYADDPHAAYDWMRANDPVHWDEANGLWGVSRYDDLVAVEKDKELFISSGQAENGYRPKMPADASIIGLDDPEHLKRRLLVSRRFTPRAAGLWEDEVRDHVTALLDAAEDKGTVEVINDLAAPLPAMMIGKLLGYPHELWPKLKEWSERTIQLGGGPMYMNDDGPVAVFEFAAACLEIYEDRKGCPADDVMSVWTEAEKNGGIGEYEFGIDQIVSDCLLLLDGGAETTRTVLGRTLLNLIANPDQWELLRNGADMTVAVEEFIRYVTPIHNMCRAASRDTVLNGKEIKAGDQLALLYSSANRDEAHFENPHAFDVTRDPNPHVAFGFGTHFCMGASLARLEIKIFFEEFVRRFSGMQLTPGTEVKEMHNAFVFGLESAHIDLTPA